MAVRYSTTDVFGYQNTSQQSFIDTISAHTAEKEEQRLKNRTAYLKEQIAFFKKVRDGEIDIASTIATLELELVRILLDVDSD